MKFLTLLLSLIQYLFNERDKAKLRQEERKDIQEQLDANVAKAESVCITPDPDRDQRLRDRFDRNRDKG